ncbi:MAG: hypothetical protein ACRDI1_01145 [Actinomycetota bacterium]
MGCKSFRFGILLAIMLSISMLPSPAMAKSEKSGSGSEKQPPGQAGKAESTTDSESQAKTNSGNGMNRQGGPGTHPGKGWKDPGQVQGTFHNQAEPDCTGNRSTDPQATNLGSCDDALGAADKPGGSGGFDADKDWNDGCGNDTDFEDDNNGRCGGRKADQPPPPPPPPPHPPPPGDGGVGGPRPAQVLGRPIPAPPAAPAGQLPATGVDFTSLLLSGLGLMALGRKMTRYGSKKR